MAGTANGHTQGGGGGAPLPDIAAVATADHGLAGMASGLPALDLNWVDTRYRNILCSLLKVKYFGNKNILFDFLKKPA